MASTAETRRASFRCPDAFNLDKLTIDVDVDLPGVTRTLAYGINPEFDIVGNYSNATGVHGFLLTKRGGE